MSKVLDTRDLQERLDELQDEWDSFVEEKRESHESHEPDEPDDLEDFDEESAKQQWVDDNTPEYDELQELKSMADEISEWRHGETLIREDYWEEYVEEMLKDCGDLPQDIPHYIVIDWKATADNIAADYSTLEYQGNTYYYRNC